MAAYLCNLLPVISTPMKTITKIPIFGPNIASVYCKLLATFIEFSTKHRAWVVLIFVLPISLLFDIFYALRVLYIMKMHSAPQLHAKRVKNIQQQISHWKNSAKSTQLCTARPGWQSISPGYRPYKKVSTGIRIELYDILSLNDKDKTITVEPMVNMGQISHFLIPKGYTIPVLPEMDDLTVGGLFMGVGIETSSHIYGLFNDCVSSCQLILCDGSLLSCSKTENSDLFDALPWSYGTLGFLVSITLKIIPCKQYVRIEYTPCHTKTDCIKTFRTFAESNDPPQFLECLAFSENNYVVMSGNFADGNYIPNSKKNHIGKWYKPWFYKYVETFLKQPCHEKNKIEYIPLRHYYHRHTKSIFWELEQIIPFGNNLIFRWLLGWAVPPKVSFLKLTQTKALQKLYETKHVTQDMMVPIRKMGEALEIFDDKYGVYPLWICPYRAYDYTKEDGTLHRCFLKKPLRCDEEKGYEMYVDLGAYGVPKACVEKKEFDIVETSREVEHYVRSIHGFQMLYADSYMTRNEFREMFDHTHYDKMKKKYDPIGAFPEIFEKTCKKASKMWNIK